MDNQHLSIRPFEAKDIELIADYWLLSPSAFLKSIGADQEKIPDREDFTNFLVNQLQKPLIERRSYGVIWLWQNFPIGHSNVNPFIYGQTGCMHFHIWSATNRGKGLGEIFAKKSVKHYFDCLNLTELYAEPYSLNESANKMMSKIGFTLKKSYLTTPGSINFEQSVNRWLMAKSAIL